MNVLVLGAGIVGISTAWYLLEHGHAVTVVDRQPGAALETSFANGAQISVSFCEPWANAAAPLKVLKWLARDDAPLLFRPKLDPWQWWWGAAFLAQCSDAAFERNVAQLVALGRYSHESLKALVAQTGIADADYHRLERGILHFFGSDADLRAGVAGAELMRRHGVERSVLTRAEVLQIEPALATHAAHIAGGIYTPSDESGDARAFTAELARRCAARGARMLFGHAIDALERDGDRIAAVRVHALAGAAGARAEAEAKPKAETLRADAVVCALGSYTAPLLRTVGVRLNIYPAKGYSATLKLRRPERASTVSMIDDARKIAISRLGDHVRIAGTAELAGYDVGLDGPTARVRCQALVSRYEDIFPGVADLTTPNFWAGLRPSTPTNIPYIGRSRIGNLWVNAGHGTLGWTHGAGSGRALAELLSGGRPALDFDFYGEPRRPRSANAGTPPTRTARPG